MPTGNSSGNNQIFPLALVEDFGFFDYNFKRLIGLTFLEKKLAFQCERSTYSIILFSKI